MNPTTTHQNDPAAFRSVPDSMRHCGWEWEDGHGHRLVLTSEGPDEWLIGLYPIADDDYENDGTDVFYQYGDRAEITSSLAEFGVAFPAPTR